MELKARVAAAALALSAIASPALAADTATAVLKDPEGKEVLQYVQRGDFDKVTQPLRAMEK